MNHLLAWSPALVIVAWIGIGLIMLFTGYRLGQKAMLRELSVIQDVSAFRKEKRIGIVAEQMEVAYGDTAVVRNRDQDHTVQEYLEGTTDVDPIATVLERHPLRADVPR